MPKFFVVSDVHGFYHEMLDALDKAGFDPHNKDHWLVSCGDNFDRGPCPEDVMVYLTLLPRKVLIKGNHEDLLMECINRGHGLSHDFSNGTVQTILDLAPNAQPFYVACAVAEERVKDFIGSMVNYFETKNYIFVHSWVPLNCDDDYPPYYVLNRKLSKMEDWREANDVEWEDSRWHNPFELAEQGLLPDKTLVFGHFHTSYARSRYENKPEFGPEADFSQYYGDGYIALDACCAVSGKINCVILEDDFIDDKST